jgi:hypothetical protein
MPSNVTTIAGATQVDLYLGNYTYANIAASMAPLKMKLATDLNLLVYKNADGTPFKIVADGDSRLTDNRTATIHALDDSARHSVGSLTDQYAVYRNGTTLASLPISLDGSSNLAATPTGGELSVTSPASTDAIIVALNTTPANKSYLAANNNGSVCVVGVESSAGNNLIAGGAPYASVIRSYPDRPLHLGQNNKILLNLLSQGVVEQWYDSTHKNVNTVDTSGNLTIAPSGGYSTIVGGLQINNSDNVHYCDFTVDSSGNLTIAPSGGTTNVTGALNVSSIATITRTTEQLRLAYDGSNYSSQTVGSSGYLTVNPSGHRLYLPADLYLQYSSDVSKQALALVDLNGYLSFNASGSRVVIASGNDLQLGNAMVNCTYTATKSVIMKDSAGNSFYVNVTPVPA